MDEEKTDTTESGEGREVYILTIYRHGSAGEGSLVGTLEAIGGGKKASFRTKAELLRAIEQLKGER